MKIAFSVPSDKLSAAMCAEWRINDSAATELIDGEESTIGYKRSGEEKTAWLFITRPNKDGKVKVLLWGENPSTKWLK